MWLWAPASGLLEGGLDRRSRTDGVEVDEVVSNSINPSSARRSCGSTTVQNPKGLLYDIMSEEQWGVGLAGGRLQPSLQRRGGVLTKGGDKRRQ
ncbi:unnamed protein product [Arctogadus glacialis]